MQTRGAFELTPTEQAMKREDRIELRKEKLLRYLLETPEALQNQAVRGMVALGHAGKSRMAPWHQSNTPYGPVDTSRFRTDEDGVPVEWGAIRGQSPREVFTDWGVPELRRRTLEERIQSMVRRILESPPELQNRLLAEAAGEYWKEGMPVTQDALRAAAAKALNRGHNRGPYRIQATRTKSTGGK